MNTFYFGDKETLEESKNLTWYYESEYYNEKLKGAKKDKKTKVLLDLRMHAFFDFINGILNVSTNNSFTEWLKANYHSEDVLDTKILYLDKELTISYDDHLTEHIRDRDSQKSVIEIIGDLNMQFDLMYFEIIKKLVFVKYKYTEVLWKRIIDSIFQFKFRVVEDLMQIGKNFSELRRKLLEAEYNNITPNYFLLEFEDPLIPITYKTTKLPSLALLMWLEMKERLEYQRLYETLVLHKKFLDKLPIFNSLLNGVTTILKFENRSDFKDVKFIVNDLFNYSHNGKKLFYLSNNQPSDELDAKNEMLQFIYKPVRCKKPKFTLEGPLSIIYSFIHFFYTNPVLNRASNDELILSGIDYLNVFTLKKGKKITKSAVTKYLHRQKNKKAS